MAVGAIFWSTLLLSFGFSLFLAGLFGAYSGRGRSRSIAFVLTLAALLVVALCAALTFPLVPGLATVFDPNVLGQSIVAVLAATVGTALAVILFITSVVRS